MARTAEWNGVDYPVESNITPEQVRAALSQLDPEIANADYEVCDEDGDERIVFTARAGTKG